MTTRKTAIFLLLLLLGAGAAPFAASLAAASPPSPTSPPLDKQSGSSLLLPWLGSAVIASLISFGGQLLVLRRQLRKDTKQEEDVAIANSSKPNHGSNRRYGCRGFLT